MSRTDPAALGCQTNRAKLEDSVKMLSGDETVEMIETLFDALRNPDKDEADRVAMDLPSGQACVVRSALVVTASLFFGIGKFLHELEDDQVYSGKEALTGSLDKLPVHQRLLMMVALLHLNDHSTLKDIEPVFAWTEQPVAESEPRAVAQREIRRQIRVGLIFHRAFQRVVAKNVGLDRSASQEESLAE